MNSNLIDKEKEALIQKNLLLLKYKVQEQRLEKLWLQFEEAGFNPILIKGWAAALKYPNPAERLYVDVDLVFSAEEFEKAETFKAANTFELVTDLHKEARHLDSLEFSKLFENSTIKKCGQANVRILSEEDHLRILCVHWLNDGGADKERLWDIYYAIENRQKDFDWEKCLEVVNKKRRFWVICAIGLAHRFLELKIEEFPFKEEIKKIPNWVYRTVEREWSSEVKLIPIYSVYRDRSKLWQQIKKRLNPNPIQATIDVRGAFNNTPRIFYQVADVFVRIGMSWKRSKKIKGLYKIR